MWRFEDSFVELTLSFHHGQGSRGRTQAVRFARKVPSPSKPCHQSFFMFMALCFGFKLWLNLKTFKIEKRKRYISSATFKNLNIFVAGVVSLKCMNKWQTCLVFSHNCVIYPLPTSPYGRWGVVPDLPCSHSSGGWPAPLSIGSALLWCPGEIQSFP